MKKSLMSVERLLWQSGSDVYRQYVLEDAIIVLGEHETVSRDDAIAFFERMDTDGRRWFNIHFDDLRCVNLDGNSAIISYRACGNVRGRKSRIYAQCMSLYMRREGVLRVAFHQQLPAKQ